MGTRTCKLFPGSLRPVLIVMAIHGAELCGPDGQLWLDKKAERQGNPGL
jgi:hypothetical protein